MERNELIEWIVMLLVIVAWWPKIFLNYDPGWYHVLIYLVTPLTLMVIFAVRYRRVREGFEYSKKIIDAQHKASGKNVLGSDGGPTPPTPPMPPGAENRGSDQD